MPSSESLECKTLQRILVSDEIKFTSLSDIRSVRAWDFSWPTLTQNHRFTARHTYKSDTPLLSALKAHNKGITHSLLSRVGALDGKNSIVLYGGALVDFILKREKYIKDWDLRLIGPEFLHNEEACVNAAKTFVDSAFEWIREQNEQIQIRNVQHKENRREEEELFDINAVKMSRKSSTITFIVPATRQYQRTVLQLTFYPYASVRDMFQSSRPHCSRIAIQGGQVILDEAARYCLESLCVVLDTKSLTHCRQGEEGPDHARALTSEIQRAVKYFQEKGLDIILPDLDMTKVPTRNLKFQENEVLDLPVLTVIYRQIENNKIMVSNLQEPPKNAASCPTVFDGYDGDIDMQLSPASSIHHNIRCLLADAYDKFHFVVEGELVSPIFDFCPMLTPRMVDKAYETVKAHLNSGTIKLDEVIQYFYKTPPAEVIKRLVVEPIQKTAKTTGLPASFEMQETVLDEIIATEKKWILSKLDTLREKMVEEGLDKLVVEFPEAVSTEDDIAKAMYGDYRATGSSNVL